jgi:hypothetical protein
MEPTQPTVESVRGSDTMADNLSIGYTRVAAQRAYGPKPATRRSESDEPRGATPAFTAEFEEALAALKKANGHVQNARSYIGPQEAGQAASKQSQSSGRLDIRA